LAVASVAPTTGSIPLSVRVNARGINFPHICVGVHNRASKPKSVRRYRRHRCIGHTSSCCCPASAMRLLALLSLPLLFSGCAGASIGRVYPCFVAITRCHRIAPPATRPLCRCCRRRHYRRRIAIATVATTTMVPPSNGCNPQDSAIALPEV